MLFTIVIVLIVLALVYVWYTSNQSQSTLMTQLRQLSDQVTAKPSQTDLDSIRQQLQVITGLGLVDKIKQVDTALSSLATSISLDDVRTRVDEMSKSLQGVNSVFSDTQQTIDTLRKHIADIQSAHDAFTLLTSNHESKLQSQIDQIVVSGENTMSDMHSIRNQMQSAWQSELQTTRQQIADSISAMKDTTTSSLVDIQSAIDGVNSKVNEIATELAEAKTMYQSKLDELQKSIGLVSESVSTKASISDVTELRVMVDTASTTLTELRAMVDTSVATSATKDAVAALTTSTQQAIDSLQSSLSTQSTNFTKLESTTKAAIQDVLSTIAAQKSAVAATYKSQDVARTLASGSTFVCSGVVNNGIVTMDSTSVSHELLLSVLTQYIKNASAAPISKITLNLTSDKAVSTAPLSNAYFGGQMLSSASNWYNGSVTGRVLNPIANPFVPTAAALVGMNANTTYTFASTTTSNMIALAYNGVLLLQSLKAYTLRKGGSIVFNFSVTVGGTITYTPMADFDIQWQAGVGYDHTGTAFKKVSTNAVIDASNGLLLPTGEYTYLTGLATLGANSYTENYCPPNGYLCGLRMMQGSSANTLTGICCNSNPSM